MKQTLPLTTEEQNSHMPKWVQWFLIILVIAIFLGIFLTIILSLVNALH